MYVFSFLCQRWLLATRLCFPLSWWSVVTDIHGCPAKDCNYSSFLLPGLVGWTLLDGGTRCERKGIGPARLRMLSVRPLLLGLLCCLNAGTRLQALRDGGTTCGGSLDPWVTTWKWAAHWPGTLAGTVSWGKRKCPLSMMYLGSFS